MSQTSDTPLPAVPTPHGPVMSSDPRPTPSSLEPPVDRCLGRVLGGKYRVDAFLGAGSMGRVYRATQEPLDRVVAVKVLNTNLGADPMAPQRFLREAQAASRIDHPNSVAVYDFGHEPDGTAFIVMEYLRGETLEDVLAREGSLPVARCVSIVGQVLAALDEAHERGVVHRDVKPENVMLIRSPEGERDAPRVKVTDFGIAKVLDDPAWHSTRLTATGITPGSPAYMSPEQASAREVDGRSDLYQCGVILFEMITGELPFHGDSAVAMLMHQINDPPPSPRSLAPRCPEALEAVILKAMAKKPDRRFASARAMRHALRSVPTDEVVAPAELNRHERPTPLLPPPMFSERPSTQVESTPATSLSIRPAPPSRPMTSLRGFVVASAIGAAAFGLAVSQRPPPVSPRPVRVTTAVPVRRAPVEVPPMAPVEVPPTAPRAVVFDPPAPPVVARPTVARPVFARPTAAPRPAIVRPTAPTIGAPYAAVVVPPVEAPVAPPAEVADDVPPVAVEAPAAPVEVAASAPPPRGLTGVDGTIVGMQLTGGITRASVQSRATEAAASLGRCSFLAAGMLGDEASFTAATTVHVTVLVRDRRADEVRMVGGHVAACREAVLGAFRGELPQGEDIEYEVRMAIRLEPRR